MRQEPRLKLWMLGQHSSIYGLVLRVSSYYINPPKTTEEGGNISIVLSRENKTHESIQIFKSCNLAQQIS